MSAKGPTSAGPSALDRKGPYTIPVSNVRGGPIDQGGPFTGGSAGFRFVVQPTSQIVEDGTVDVEFTVVVAGAVGTPTYQWQVDTGSGFGDMIGETAATLTIAEADIADDGNEYRCEVTDDNETVTSNAATLTVYAALAISVQPSPQTVDVDDTATFSVTATGGFGALTYQWQVDTGAGFGNITGATSASYETGVLTALDDGNEYRCVVTDSIANEVTSDAALLTVNAAFDPTDNANVVEIYNAWDETLHSYVAARTAASYEAAAGVVTLTCTENPTGFSTTGAGDVVVVSCGNAEVDGEFTITGASGATITYAQPFVSPTVSPVSLTGTVQWKHRKVSQVAGMKGVYNFTQATLANMPQWNATAKELLFIEARSYHLKIPSGLTNALQDGGPRGIIASYRAVASSGEGNIIGNSFGNTSNYLRIYRTDTTLASQFTNTTTSPTAFIWTDGSANNGNTKLHASNAESSGGALWVNDMVTSKASNATDITATNAADLFVGRRQSVYFDGAINSIVFAGAALDQTYRENFKAWAEAAPRSASFG